MFDRFKIFREIFVAQLFFRKQVTCIFARQTTVFQESFSVGPGKEIPVEFNIFSRRAGNKTCSWDLLSQAPHK